MLDVGWSEILVIAIVLIVVVGPKDLPGLLRQFGRTTAKMRAMAGDFRRQFDEALKEAELDDVKDLAREARSFDPRSTIKKHLSPMEKAARDIKSGLDGAMKPKPDQSAVAASSEPKAAEPLKAGSAEAVSAVAGRPAQKAGAAETVRAKPTAGTAKAKAGMAAKGKSAANGKKPGASAKPVAAKAAATKAKPAAARTRSAGPATAAKPVARKKKAGSPS